MSAVRRIEGNRGWWCVRMKAGRSRHGGWSVHVLTININLMMGRHHLRSPSTGRRLLRPQITALGLAALSMWPSAVRRFALVFLQLAARILDACRMINVHKTIHEEDSVALPGWPRRDIIDWFSKKATAAYRYLSKCKARVLAIIRYASKLGSEQFPWCKCIEFLRRLTSALALCPLRGVMISDLGPCCHYASKPVSEPFPWCIGFLRCRSPASPLCPLGGVSIFDVNT